MRTDCWRWMMLFACFGFSSFTASAQFLKDTYRFYNNLPVSAPDCGPDLVPTVAAGNCVPVFLNGGNFLMIRCGRLQNDVVISVNNFLKDKNETQNN